jgi:hypothetical protein
MMVFPEQTMETYASDRAAAKLAQEMRRKRPIKRQAGNVNWGSGTAGAGKAPPHAI